MASTTAPIGKPVAVTSVNVAEGDRFVASLVSSYGNDMDGVTSVEQAAAAAYAMTLNAHSDQTVWAVKDNQTGLVTYLEQADFEDIVLNRGFI